MESISGSILGVFLRLILLSVLDLWRKENFKLPKNLKAKGYIT